MERGMSDYDYYREKADLDDDSKSFSLLRDAIQLSIGAVYKHKQSGDEYQLLEFIDYHQALFKNLLTLQNEVLSIHLFQNVAHSGNSAILLDIDEIGDDNWKKAQKKLFAIKPLINSDEGYNGTQGLYRRAEEIKVSSRTLRRWLEAYRKTNSIASLVDRKRGWAEGKRRISHQHRHLIDEVIQDFYLTIQRPTVEATVKEVFRQCHARGLKKPSKNAIRYQINRVSEKDYLKSRGYRERAKNKFTPKVGQFPNVHRPLDVIQIDHTPADIILVDDTHRKPIGRPFITVAIDIYSRMITGYYISLDAPSVTSVAMCLTRSILPKNDLLLKYGIDGVTWDVFGIPKKIHVDNGSDFRAESLNRSCSLYGIGIEYRPLARPEFGGHIERLIGNIMEKVHSLPGTTFSNIHQKDNYNSEKHASLTLDEFETWFLIYITKDYHQRVHSALGCSPAAKWRIGIFGDSVEQGMGIPSYPADAQSLILDFMPSFQRTIQHTGVTIDGINYYDPCLNAYINARDEKTNSKKKFTFRQDPRDISVLWFFDPSLKSYFKIPYANQALPQMSAWDYSLVKKRIKEQSGTINEALIYQAWQDMQDLVESSQQNTKSLRRQAQRRKKHIESQDYHRKSELEVELGDAPQLEIMPKLDVKPITPSPTQSPDDDGADYFEDIE